jgi:hypothetical protein
VAPWAKELTAQPAARLALTAAVVDRGTIRIDDYEGIVGVDRVERDGHLYSDKAPGQPFLAIPFYASARAAGADSPEAGPVEGNLTQWWITLWSAAVPGALVVVLMARLGEHAGARRGTLAALAIGFGTLLLPFSAELYGHVLATLLGLAAWALVRRERTTGRVLAAGAVAGLSVLVEYQMVLFVAVIAVFLLVRGGWRATARFAVGGLPFAVPLLAYQAAAFGSAFRTSYGEKPVHDSGGATIVGVPDPRQALEVLLGARGLLVFTPVVAVALVGLIRMVRQERGPSRDDAVVGLSVFVAYLALQAGWPNPWGGEMPGPRYMIPALPLLAPGIAAAWRRHGVLERGALGWSVLVMSLPLITLHLVGDGGITGFEHLRNIDRFGVSTTVWTLALGGLGWVVHAATVAGAAGLLWRELATRSPASVAARLAPTPSSPDRR